MAIAVQLQAANAAGTSVWSACSRLATGVLEGAVSPDAPTPPGRQPRIAASRRGREFILAAARMLAVLTGLVVRCRCRLIACLIYCSRHRGR
jgi:hypothetical protein